MMGLLVLTGGYAPAEVRPSRSWLARMTHWLFGH